MATGDSEAVTLGQFKAWAATQAGGVDPKVGIDLIGSGEGTSETCYVADYQLVLLIASGNESWDPASSTLVPVGFMEEVGEATFAGDGYSPVRVSYQDGEITCAPDNQSISYRVYGIK